MFTASEGTPFSAIEIGCGAMRRPLSKVSVLPEPMPRRSIEATSPRASCGPLLISVIPEISAAPSVSNSSAIVAAPRASSSLLSMTVTGSAVSASTRRILEPVTVNTSSFTASSADAPAARVPPPLCAAVRATSCRMPSASKINRVRIDFRIRVSRAIFLSR